MIFARVVMRSFGGDGGFVLLQRGGQAGDPAILFKISWSVS